MKKILWLLFLSFSFLNVYVADTMIGDSIGYYYKVDGEVKEMKKYHLRGSKFIQFKKDCKNDTFGDVNYDFKSYEETPLLETIIYYGYNAQPTDENYYYTQIYIWQNVYHYEVTMCDREGSSLEGAEEKLAALEEKIQKHNTQEDFFKEPIRKEIWTTSSFNFNSDLDFDMPSVRGLGIKKNLGGVEITNNEVGEYTLNYQTTYPPFSKWYSYGDIRFLNSTQGPSKRTGVINYTVYGTPLKVKEELVGINGKLGDITDAFSSYELYLNDSYKKVVYPQSIDYIKSMENYTLKGGYSPYLEDFKEVNFYVANENEYELTILRKVLGYKVSINILDNNTYYVYLKSNNELYYLINKDIKEITLPYGTYYITNLAQDYNLTLEVLGNEEELKVEINNPSKPQFTESKKITENIEVKEPKEEEKEVKEIEPEILKEDHKEEIINPQTNDNIYFYVLTLFSSCTLILSILISSSKREDN